MFYLPNGNYYAQIHGMNQTELVETLKSVQFYCGLQIASLLLLCVALHQILGLSPVHQLAFVLEKQFVGIQNKMIFWVFYNVQASLQHNGKLAQSCQCGQSRYEAYLSLLSPQVTTTHSNSLGCSTYHLNEKSRNVLNTVEAHWNALAVIFLVGRMAPIWRVFINLWESTQVELHGKCSEERILELAKYSTETSWLRVLAVLFITPLVCLIVTVAVDLLPLADPSEGVSSNKMFFARTFYTFVVVTALVVLQFRGSVRILPYPLKRVVVNTILVSLCAVGLMYSYAQTIGFPCLSGYCW